MFVIICRTSSSNPGHDRRGGAIDVRQLQSSQENKSSFLMIAIMRGLLELLTMKCERQTGSAVTDIFFQFVLLTGEHHAR